jgi:uncharacterized protein
MTRTRALRRTAVAGAFACAACWLPTAAGAAPSFDCARAAANAEFLICEHPPLAKLDQQIADIYFALLEALPPAEADRFRDEQRQFLQVRDECGMSAGLPRDCVESRMWERLRELQLLQADLTGAPVLSGGDVIVAPGITWQASLPDAIPDTAYRLDSGAILCAVGLPEQPTIGTAGSTGCRIAQRGADVEVPVFHTLLAGVADYGWARTDHAGTPPAGAVTVWRNGDDQVMVCRALLEGTYHIGTLTVGDACVALFTQDEVEVVVEEVVMLAGFEVMTAPE